LNGLHGIVNWPADEEDCREIAHRFQEFAGVPDIVGAVDGTLIAIRCPSTHATTFRQVYMFYQIDSKILLEVGTKKRHSIVWVLQVPI
jgi:hypothetical protein